MVAPNIEYSAKMDNIEKAPNLVDYTGLNLIDFNIVPHYQNREFNDYSEVLDLRDTKFIEELKKYNISLMDWRYYNDGKASFRVSVCQ